MLPLLYPNLIQKFINQGPKQLGTLKQNVDSMSMGVKRRNIKYTLQEVQKLMAFATLNQAQVCYFQEQVPESTQSTIPYIIYESDLYSVFCEELQRNSCLVVLAPGFSSLVCFKILLFIVSKLRFSLTFGSAQNNSITP